MPDGKKWYLVSLFSILTQEHSTIDIGKVANFLSGWVLEKAMLLRKKGSEVKLFPVMRKIPQCLKAQHFAEVAMLNTGI